MVTPNVLSEALVAGGVHTSAPFDLWDDASLDRLRATLNVPRPIAEVEAIEAWIKRLWIHHGVHALDERTRARFAEFFLRIGVLPKYKSYAVKYATPFGYSLFDQQDGGGFSIQLHETAKIEAFHVVGVHPRAFILLCTPDEWVEYGSEMVKIWNEGRPEDSHLAYRPSPGDVAIVENLSTVHTVVGCLVEEFATSSYDVVRRIHDQNSGRRVILPPKHKSLANVLQAAEILEPRRRVRKLEQWATAEIPQGDCYIANLPDEGLVGRHACLIRDSNHIVDAVGSTSVLTVVILRGDISLTVDGIPFRMRTGDVTALAPGSNYHVTSIGQESHISLCEVSLDIAFADLR